MTGRRRDNLTIEGGSQYKEGEELEACVSGTLRQLEAVLTAPLLWSTPASARGHGWRGAQQAAAFVISIDKGPTYARALGIDGPRFCFHEL